VVIRRDYSGAIGQACHSQCAAFRSTAAVCIARFCTSRAVTV